MKYYAVKQGKQTGIFTDWGEAKEYVIGFKGAEYKSFKSEIEAQNYMNGVDIANPVLRPTDEDTINLFIDGSYKEGIVAFGVYMQTDIEDITLCGCTDSCIGIQSRNVAGELASAIIGVQSAIYLYKRNINIIYDYNGIEAWYSGLWERRSDLARMYVDTLNKLKDSHMKYNFIKVSGHRGVIGNEKADKLATKAINQKLYVDFNSIFRGDFNISEDSFFSKKLI